jgi:hypothetical protein
MKSVLITTFFFFAIVVSCFTQSQPAFIENVKYGILNPEDDYYFNVKFKYYMKPLYLVLLNKNDVKIRDISNIYYSKSAYKNPLTTDSCEIDSIIQKNNKHIWLKCEKDNNKHIISITEGDNNKNFDLNDSNKIKKIKNQKDLNNDVIVEYYKNNTIYDKEISKVIYKGDTTFYSYGRSSITNYSYKDTISLLFNDTYDKTTKIILKYIKFYKKSNNIYKVDSLIIDKFHKCIGDSEFHKENKYKEHYFSIGSYFYNKSSFKNGTMLKIASGQPEDFWYMLDTNDIEIINEAEVKTDEKNIIFSVKELKDEPSKINISDIRISFYDEHLKKYVDSTIIYDINKINIIPFSKFNLPLSEYSVFISWNNFIYTKSSSFKQVLTSISDNEIVDYNNDIIKYYDTLGREISNIDKYHGLYLKTVKTKDKLRSSKESK